MLLVAGLVLTTMLPIAIAPAAAQTTPPPLPARWPASLQIGSGSAPGEAAAMRAQAPYGFRYQYLSGGVNTGNGWATWNANGDFARYYIDDSVRNGITPVFTYYMIYSSRPGGGAEIDAVQTNLRTPSTMQAYFNDLKLFFQKAAAFPDKLVVLHVEPDMWGYIQQRTSNDDAATFAVSVSSSGVAEVAGLPDNAAGLAQGIKKLRDTYAPNVALGYHVSIWGTGTDIQFSQTDDATTDALATRAGNLYRSLRSDWDIAFAEFSDRDAAFKQYQYGDGGRSWFDADDFRRHARFLSTFSRTANERVVLWQIPLGNTRMRAQNNTWGHYQDNRVEWLLEDSTRAHLQTYIDGGTVAFLFGGGASGTTCACDAVNDGVTDPAPINGNDRLSLSADDDGGFFKERVRAYYAAGVMPLSGGSTTPPPPAPTPAPSTQPSFSAGASSSQSSVSPGSTVSLTASVTASANATALVDLELVSPSGTKVFQQAWDSQSFSAGQTRTFTASWSVPSTAATGTYSVKVGVFAPGWASVYTWNDNAAQVTVAASNAPAPTPTPTPAPAPPATDTTPPATPSVTNPSTGSSTRNNTYTITGTAEANSLVRVWVDANANGRKDAGESLAGSQQLSGGSTLYSVSVSLKRNSANEFVVTATDAAGNESQSADVATISQSRK
jgi:hypothetical protein